MNISERTTEIFAREGVIARTLENFTIRPQQQRMAAVVARTIENNECLIAEAGTGIGKSLAYLVPFIVYAAEADKKVVISTNTKTLQDQLYLKDLPFLAKALDEEFSYALCLGSENYLCLRRLNIKEEERTLFEDVDLTELQKIKDWSYGTEAGIRAELNFVPKSGAWQSVCREGDLCLGKKCRYHNMCFYYRARAAARKARILVTNHSLFFANLSIGGRVLPDYDAVVFDEAHTLEQVATSYLGMGISNTRIKHMFDSIYNSKTKRGLLAKLGVLKGENFREVDDAIKSARKAHKKFFEDIDALLGEHIECKRIRSGNPIPNSLDSPLGSLHGSLSRLLDLADNEEDRAMVKSYLKRCGEARKVLAFILDHSDEEYVYWLERRRRGRHTRYTLLAAPIEIGAKLKEQLFSDKKPVILTSATMTAGGGFSFIKGRLGIDGDRELLLDSPFDYRRNVLQFLPEGIKDPGEDMAKFERDVFEKLHEIVGLIRGRTFVLFTNYRVLNAAYERLAAAFSDVVFYRQGDKPRYELLRNFKEDENSVLLGTDSFWQGVDVPGRALECVVITKLPFLVPDDPINEARMELIRARGGDSFKGYQLPRALMTFKQGFGRLIRTEADKGVVAILDPRIRSRSYGKEFISNLPECGKTSDIDEIARFFGKK